MNNERRVAELRRVRRAAPKFQPGDLVKARVGEETREGVIDAVFADLKAAEGLCIIPVGWYEMLSPPSKSPKTTYWYGVILPKGAVLNGENDLQLAEKPS